MKRSCDISVDRRFVILWHEVPAGSERASHFDLMFEHDGGLRTWAVETLPRDNERTVHARLLPLHRLSYLEYEGEISHNRGRVTRVAAGVFQMLVDRPHQVVLETMAPPCRGRLVFQLLADADWEVCLEPPSSRGTGKSEAS